MARRDESDEVASIWLRSRAAAAPSIPPPVHSAAVVRRWFRKDVIPSTGVWVVDEHNVLTGILVLREDWIDQLYVDVPHAGRGIGGRLIAHAKERRPERLQLWTFQSNAEARRFYVRHGFRPMETTDGDNEEGAPDVRYEWRPGA